IPHSRDEILVLNPTDVKGNQVGNCARRHRGFPQRARKSVEMLLTELERVQCGRQFRGSFPGVTHCRQRKKAARERRPELSFAVLDGSECQPTWAARSWTFVSVEALGCVGSVRTVASCPSQSRVSRTISPSGNSSAS